MPIPNDMDDSACIAMEMDNYKKSGKIGNTHPKNPAHAQQIAAAICLNRKKAPAEPGV